jgi:hypothetical protein
MPNVNGKKFPYTKKGKEAAMKAMKKAGKKASKKAGKRGMSAGARAQSGHAVASRVAQVTIVGRGAAISGGSS